MRKTRLRDSFWLVIPLVVIIPPVGLALLWTSRHSVRVKTIVCAIFVLLAAGTTVGVLKSGVLGQSPIPPGGYDVSVDERGYYRTGRILPFEQEIFSAVVKEMSGSQVVDAVPQGEPAIPEDVDPQAQAFRKVAVHYGLEYEDVKAIYLKVSSYLSIR